MMRQHLEPRMRASAIATTRELLDRVLDIEDLRREAALCTYVDAVRHAIHDDLPISLGVRALHPLFAGTPLGLEPTEAMLTASRVREADRALDEFVARWDEPCRR